MSNHPNRSQIKPRPTKHVEAAGSLYPSAWRQIDEFRENKGKDLPIWPDWCFAPFAAWYAIVCAENNRSALDLQLVGDVGRLAALGAWRVTQGIYRFDPALYEAIIATPVDGNLPCDVLYRLPEWCVYIETPNLKWGESQLHGIFAHLEWDANTNRHELRLLLDSEEILVSLPLHLGDWALADAIDSMYREAGTQAALRGIPTDNIPKIDLAPSLQPLISLLLYLCSANAEIGDDSRAPKFPQPKKTKNGWRLFPTDKPTSWDVGVRIGAALRRAYHESETSSSDATHGSPRPHIRRAHWHGYWQGPKNTPSERKLSLKWLPPIAVNVADDGSLVPTIRPVV